ncbi:two-component system-sensor histidine kinase [Tenacibaculum maritimum]|uniref:tetratricopeptide repeat-containing sensor histidine kinase n=1 Tax=Tenacibaculum maritimum TaxID=107401 RepID=UPI0012E45B08|nr:histidine kinase [Tenacibaculum maritimum]CAA0223640.1 two-component system-sensor histidine kinase [Tenacibaculum maritimum]
MNRFICKLFLLMFIPVTPMFSQDELISSEEEMYVNTYQRFIDSVEFYKNNNLEKSLHFIEKSLERNPKKQQVAKAYSLLGEVYMNWKQYDLAEDSYQLSLKVMRNEKVLFLKGKSLYLQKKYDESIAVLLQLEIEKLSDYEKTLRLELLGSNYLGKGTYTKAEIQFKKALEKAEAYGIVSKITDINSALANLYAKRGEATKANTFYNNSLKLATSENKKRALKEKEKVADYLNSSNRYDEEIELRKETLEEVESKKALLKDLKTERDSISTQKINYKIGRAYALKEEYNSAISYLKKSKTDAYRKKDLIIEKDATRKLSEIYATVGDYTKALKSYENYVQLVDKSYIKKEQEIHRSKQLSQKNLENLNRILSLEKDRELTEIKINLAYKDQELSKENSKKQKMAIYSLIVGILLLSGIIYLFYRNIKQQKIANNLLALKSMRSQMNPHFIFNALNSVNNFIALNDERSANRYLSDFSKLMRSVLENSEEDFIPLSKEIALLRLYVKLEHDRFKDKFEYSLFIDEKIQQDQYLIPPMLLQPYIENAIWHGLRYKKSKGLLEVSMKQQKEGYVEIVIKDDGVGREKSTALKTKNQLKQKSKGMSTIKKRITILNEMYQDVIDVKVADLFKNGEGTEIKVILKKKRI